jgi:uncharacterized ion transporter superfamily protein YfcC
MINSFVFSLMVMVLGLFSLSLVTGQPLSTAFYNKEMAMVLFITGLLLSLVGYLLVPEKCDMPKKED